MANSEGLSGAHSFVIWGKETTFNTAVTPASNFSSTLQTFKANINNNTTSNYGFSGATDVEGRTVFNYTHGLLEISGNASMKVTNWTWMEHVLGAVSGSGPYVYVPAVLPPSMTIASNIDNPGAAATDQLVTYSGCVVESCTIRTSLGQPVTTDMEFKIAKADIDTTLETRVALAAEDTYNFTGGTIELPNASVLPNIIDSVELTIRNNWTMLGGLGTRLVQNAISAALAITIKVTLKYLDNDLITAALGATTPTATGGPTEYASMELNFASGSRSMAILLDDVPMTEFAQMQELQSPIGEELTFTASDITATEDRS